MPFLLFLLRQNSLLRHCSVFCSHCCTYFPLTLSSKEDNIRKSLLVRYFSWIVWWRETLGLKELEMDSIHPKKEAEESLNLERLGEENLEVCPGISGGGTIVLIPKSLVTQVNHCRLCLSQHKQESVNLDSRKNNGHDCYLWGLWAWCLLYY